MSTARLTQRAAYTPVYWAQLLPRCWMALYSLFGPGNSIVKWLLLETSTRKLWMAATAPVMVYDDDDTWWMLHLWSLLMQALFYWQSWFICHWPFLLIERSESLSFRVHCDNPLLVFCFFPFSVLSWLQAEQKGSDCWSQTVIFLLHICFPWTDLQRLVLMSSFYQSRTFCTTFGQRSGFLK